MQINYKYVIIPPVKGVFVVENQKDDKNIGWLGMKRFTIKDDFVIENEGCKDCEHCEYYIKVTDNQDNGSPFVTLLLVILVCLFSFMLYLFYQEINKPKVRIYGHDVEIGEDTYADFLIDSGLCTVDDIQKMIDELLEQ